MRSPSSPLFPSHQSPQYPPTLSTLTALSQFRNKLPLGISLGRERITEFQLFPYTTEMDFMLSRLFPEEGEVQQTHIGQIVTQVFPAIVQHIGGYSLKELSTLLGVPPLRLFDSLFAADVLTIFLNIRVESSGVDIAFTNTCPSCLTINDDDPAKGRPYHDISALDIRYCDAAPIRQVELISAISLPDGDCSIIELAPMTFGQFQQLEGCPDSLLELEVLQRQVRNRDFDYRLIRNLRDRQNLLKVSRELFRLGPDMEMAVAMLCYKCRFEWESHMAPSQAYSFYYNLLRPPKEEYLQNILFFLTFGEQAPCKSIQEAKQLPVRERNFYVQKLNESYQKQKEEMDKANRKGGKGKNIKRSF